MQKLRAILITIVVLSVLMIQAQNTHQYIHEGYKLLYGKYFLLETTFYAENPTNKEMVTYYPNGDCMSVGYVYCECYWVKGTAKGKYHIKNDVIYVEWEGFNENINERYVLRNNRYISGNLNFRLIRQK